MVSSHPTSTTSNATSSKTSWKRSFLIASLAVLSSSLITQASAQFGSGSFFSSPTKSTTWYLGETVNIRFRQSLSKSDSNNTMLYLEYTTRACQGSRPDEERYCDNRATKVSAFGQIAPGADSFQWTIPTTLDLQLSRGKFHLYDYNGHSSDSFTILPAPRRYPKVSVVDQSERF